MRARNFSNRFILFWAYFCVLTATPAFSSTIDAEGSLGRCGVVLATVVDKVKQLAAPIEYARRFHFRRLPTPAKVQYFDALDPVAKEKLLEALETEAFTPKSVRPEEAVALFRELSLITDVPILEKRLGSLLDRAISIDARYRSEKRADWQVLDAYLHAVDQHPGLSLVQRQALLKKAWRRVLAGVEAASPRDFSASFARVSDTLEPMHQKGRTILFLEELDRTIRMTSPHSQKHEQRLRDFAAQIDAYIQDVSDRVLFNGEISTVEKLEWTQFLARNVGKVRESWLDSAISILERGHLPADLRSDWSRVSKGVRSRVLLSLTPDEQEHYLRVRKTWLEAAKNFPSDWKFELDGQIARILDGNQQLVGSLDFNAESYPANRAYVRNEFTRHQDQRKGVSRALMALQVMRHPRVHTLVAMIEKDNRRAFEQAGGGMGNGMVAANPEQAKRSFLATPFYRAAARLGFEEVTKVDLERFSKYPYFEVSLP